jgi:hypothetical protein
LLRLLRDLVDIHLSPVCPSHPGSAKWFAVLSDIGPATSNPTQQLSRIFVGKVYAYTECHAQRPQQQDRGGAGARTSSRAPRQRARISSPGVAGRAGRLPTSAAPRGRSAMRHLKGKKVVRLPNTAVVTPRGLRAHQCRRFCS